MGACAAAVRFGVCDGLKKIPKSQSRHVHKFETRLQRLAKRSMSSRGRSSSCLCSDVSVSVTEALVTAGATGGYLLSLPAVPASRKVREPRLRACGGPWGSVRLRRGSERPAGKAVRGAHHRALDAKESGGRRARSRSSASNEPVRSAAAVTVAVRRHAHIRGPSRYEAGIGGATLDMRRCTLAPRGLLGRKA